jgi:hypothetical protein
MSNWAKRDLSPAQIKYAATDAWVSREIHARALAALPAAEKAPVREGSIMEWWNTPFSDGWGWGRRNDYLEVPTQSHYDVSSERWLGPCCRRVSRRESSNLGISENPTLKYRMHPQYY